MSDSPSKKNHRTHNPEYADLPVKENSLFGTNGRKCPGCGRLGAHDEKIALERDDGTYSCWTVWYCEECDKRWRASSRPPLKLWSTTVRNPKRHGYEVVGRE